MKRPIQITLIALTVVHVAAAMYVALRDPRAIPVGDAWRRLPIALAAHDGTLATADIFTPEDGHFTVFTYAMTAVLTTTTSWNLSIEVYINVLVSFLNTGLLLFLVKRSTGSLTPLKIFVVSIVALSIRQHLNWILGYFGAWHISLFFMLLSIVWLEVNGTGYLSLLMSAFLAFCASFSVMGGFAAWGVGFIYLAIGRAAFRKVILWTVLALTAVGIYVGAGGIMSTATTAVLIRDIRTWVLAVPFMLMVIGLVFDGTGTAVMGVLMGGISLLLLLANFWHIYRQQDDITFLKIWAGPVCATILTAYLIGIKRAAEFGFEIALQSSWYTTPMIPFWMALVISSICVLKTPPEWSQKRILAVGNILFLCWLALNYPVAAVASLDHPRSLRYRVQTQNTECLMHLVINRTQPEECPTMDIHPDFVNSLAIRDLAMFRNVEPVSVVQQSAGDAVVLVTASDWTSFHIQKYYLPDISTDRLFTIYMDESDTSRDSPVTPEPSVSLEEIPFERMDAFWLVTDRAYSLELEEDDRMLQLLDESGYSPGELTTHDYGITVRRVEKS